MALKNLNKSNGHICYGIERCSLYELTYIHNVYEISHIHEVLWPDTEMLTENDINAIEKILNGEE